MTWKTLTQLYITADIDDIVDDDEDNDTENVIDCSV